MTTPEFTKAADASLARDVLYAIRYYAGSWRGLLVLATIAVLAGIGFNWNWLVAAGLAPILLTALPCLVMCGLGLCMNRLIGGSCVSDPAQSKTVEPTQPEATTNIVSIKRAPPGESACCHTTPTEKTSMEEVQPLNERRDTHA